MLHFNVVGVAGVDYLDDYSCRGRDSGGFCFVLSVSCINSSTNGRVL